METGEVISTDKGTVVRLKVTQDNVMFVDGQETEGKDQNTVLEGFLKLQPKALGTVQVMIGVMVFFLGVLLTINDYNYPAILVYSGITYWGSWIFIIAGSLSVAAQDKLHPSVVCTYHLIRAVNSQAFSVRLTQSTRFTRSHATHSFPHAEKDCSREAKRTLTPTEGYY
ncbi:hypothetical protein PO909_011156 [Leuciscus waleckii]